MILKRFAILCMVLASTSTAASASSPDAWTAFYKDVKAKCIAASGLDRATAMDLTLFPDGHDELGYDVAVRIKGQYEANDGTTKVEQKLCLYNRKTHDAVTADTNPFPSTR